MIKYQLTKLIAAAKAYLRTLGRSIIGKTHKDLSTTYDAYEDLLEDYYDLAAHAAAVEKMITAKKKSTKPKG